MFLFLRLILAHFIADYPLQTDRIYCYKIRSLKGQLYHAGIHCAVFAAFLLPYWHEPLVWLFLSWITLSHLACDIVKVKLLDKTNLSSLLTYTADQLFHILAASLIFFFPFVNEIPQKSQSVLFSWYWNHNLIIFLIGFIFSTFFTTYFMACIKDCFTPSERSDGCMVSPLRKYYGILERGLIMTFCVCGGLWVLGIAFVLLFRVPAAIFLKQRGKDAAWLSSTPEIVIGSIFSVLAGILIRIYSL